MLDDGHSLEDIEARNDELREQLAAQQLRTFSRWWNSVLARRTVGTPPQVSNLCEDVRSGVLSLMLLEELSGALVRVLHPRAQTRFQMLENQNHFLALLRQKGLRFVNIGAEDLVDGKRTMLLGVTWTLILRFEIQRYGANELQLMRWVKESTLDYRGVAVTSWGESFSDGLTFCAIVHKYAPEVCEFEAFERSKPLAKLNTAFSLAEEHLGVPRLLDAEELARGVADERSVITYVAKLRQVCAEKSLERQRRQAAEAEAQLAAQRDEHRAETERLAAQLQREAEALNGWLRTQESRFTEGAQRAPGADSAPANASVAAETAAVAAELAELRESFRASEKPARAADKAALAELYAQVLSRRLVEARAAPVLGSAEGERTAKTLQVERELGQVAPAAVQRLWAQMEAAEREYERALLGSLAALEAVASMRETDAMLEALEARVHEQLAWATGTAAEMNSLAREPTPLEPLQLEERRSALGSWLEQKVSREQQRVQLQRQRHEISERREREGRPLGAEGALESAWETLEKAAVQLQAALDEQLLTMQCRAAQAETDLLCARNEVEARGWLSDVSEATATLARAVKADELGCAAAETEALLDSFRSGHLLQRRRFTERRAAIEATRREMAARRKAERRPAAEWEPSSEALGAAWLRLGGSERSYEEALLHRLGMLRAADRERLRRAALREESLAALADMLPPLVLRRQRAREAAAAVRLACAEAEELAVWAAAEAEELTARLRALESSTAEEESNARPARMRLLELIEWGANGEKGKKGAARLALINKLCEATASCQLQRAPTEADGYAALAVLDSAWAALEQAEAELKRALHARQGRLQGAVLEWERLQRGCKRLHEWLLDSQRVRECTELPRCEESAVRMLRESEAAIDELHTHAHTLETLAPLAKRLAADAELGERAAAAFAQVAPLGALAAPMAARVAELEEELERQRQRSLERRSYAAATAALEESVALALELANFPVETLDTAESISEVLERGGAEAATLLELECSEPSELRRAEDAFSEWQELAAALPQRKASCEQAKRATLHAAALRGQYEAAAAAFAEWHARCSELLRLRPASAVAAADVQRAAEIVRAQLIEGEAHRRSAAEVVRQMESMPDGVRQMESLQLESVHSAETTTLGLVAMQAALAQLHELAAALEAAALLAPPLLVTPQPVVQALDALGAAAEPPLLSVQVLEAALPAPHVRFVVEELAAEAGVLQAQSFDPFPADRLAITPLRLPATLLAPAAHALAVIERINQARTQPTRWGEQLVAELHNCFDGTAFCTPRTWGGRRLRTVEGGAAVRSLHEELRQSQPVPALRLVPALNEAAQQLADELAAGASGTPLLERLRARGTYSGNAGEAIVYGVGPPEAVAAQLLISDGDKQRRNRSFLLNGDLRVAGFGLARHPKHETVCVVTLVTLFATPLPQKVLIECQGDANAAFQQVLDALPSEQARSIATEALVSGKRVMLEYEPGSVQISVFERDGSRRCSTLKWS